MRQDTSPRGADERGSPDDGGSGRFLRRGDSVNLPEGCVARLCGLRLSGRGTAESFETREAKSHAELLGGRELKEECAQCQKDELVDSFS